MNAPVASHRVGWCPGALRPMESHDGWIVRVKPRGGRLSLGQAVGIAEAARRFGSGALDLTSRANLQIRGVAERAAPALVDALASLGLVDPTVDGEARRNVVSAPLAEIDPAAVFDIRPAVAALEDALVAAQDLVDLPAKFGFAVCHGGVLALGDVAADVRLDAIRDAAGQPGFVVRLDGDPNSTAVCSPTAMPEVALRLARAFVAVVAERPGPRRMTELVARDGAPAVLARADLASVMAPAPDSRAGGRVVGPVADVRGRAFALAVAAPFGRLAVSHLEALAALRGAMGPPIGPTAAGGPFSPRGRRWPAGPDEGAEPSTSPHPSPLRADTFFRKGRRAQMPLGRGSGPMWPQTAEAVVMHLTPWRTIVVAAPHGIEDLAAAAAVAGLVVDPADPRLGVAACVGAAGCRRGSVPTLEHAAEWARLIEPGPGIRLHLSGCAKGCAHPHAAPLTLVGRDGLYDLVVAGRPGDAPALSGLEPGEAARLVRSLLRQDSRS